MPRKLGTAVVAAAVFVACGARTELEASLGSDAGSGHPKCATANGVRLCGRGCPEIAAPDCPGVGCQRAADIYSSTPTDVGVCWADTPDKGSHRCPMCGDDELCLQRGAGVMVCVSASICEALWDLDVRTVCRFTDGSAYDGRPIAGATTCPYRVLPTGLCGGVCGPCSGAKSAFCVGRSSRHPFGVCMRDPIDLVASQCDPPCGLVAADRCGTMVVEPKDAPSARQFGLCLLADECDGVAPHVPGGMQCNLP